MQRSNENGIWTPMARYIRGGAPHKAPNIGPYPWELTLYVTCSIGPWGPIELRGVRALGPYTGVKVRAPGPYLE